MFQKINSTQYNPQRATMVWDGQCGFCAYWICYWKRIVPESIAFVPFQDLEGSFADIPEIRFKEAVRFIDLNGKVYNGPEAAYFTLYKADKVKFLYQWYKSGGFFMTISDTLYQLITDNRSTAFRITKFLWGSNPEQMRPFWAIYLFVLLYFIFI